MSLNLLPAACKPRATPDHPSVCLQSLVSFRDLKKKIFNFYLIWLHLFCFSFISQVKWLCGSRSWCVLVAQIIPRAPLKNPNVAQPLAACKDSWVWQGWRAAALPVSSPRAKHIHILCYFSPFHRRPEARGAKWTERQDLCACGTRSLYVISFSFDSDLEELFLCVDSWLYRSCKETTLLTRFVLTWLSSVFTAKWLQ